MSIRITTGRKQQPFHELYGAEGGCMNLVLQEMETTSEKTSVDSSERHLMHISGISRHDVSLLVVSEWMLFRWRR